MRIAIYGLSKTGTSALFALLKAAMPRDTDCYFEPGPQHRGQYRRRRLRQWLRPSRPIATLVKILPFGPAPGHDYDFGPFDHALLTVRDPRDRLVSQVLYAAFEGRFAERPEEAAAYLALVARKEQDPASCRLSEILEAVIRARGWTDSLDAWLATYQHKSIALPMAHADAHPELVKVRYEDMVDGRLAALSETVGLELHGKAEVGPQLQRVVRSRGHGDWRHWFTPADVELLRPILQPYLDRYYPHADWSLAREPVINPDHASRYVRRIMNERRALLRLPPLFPADP